MATYVIGDVQGCFDELQRVLQLIQFDPLNDQLWFTGDLVNRGPQSLETLRFIKQLPNPVVVLGNHDLHLIALAHQRTSLKKPHTLHAIFDAPDRDALIEWLRQQPLLHHDTASGFLLVHAGLPPQWDLALAKRCANEVEQVLRGDDYKNLLSFMYGDHPNQWDEQLSGWDRLRFIVNCFTRLRICDADGRLDLRYKGSLDERPAGFLPWFQVPWRKSKDLKILVGHWAALDGHSGEKNVYALDTGCVWGNRLTAFRLDDEKYFYIQCLQR